MRAVLASLLLSAVAASALVACAAGSDTLSAPRTASPLVSAASSPADSRTPVESTPRTGWVAKDCWPWPVLPEGTQLATDLLTPQSQGLLLDREQRDKLAAEIDRVLALVRNGRLYLAGIRARPSRVPGEVVIGLDRDLGARVRAAMHGEVESPPVAIGQDDLDELNARLGLRSLRVSWSGQDEGFAVLCLSELLNVPAAASEYSQVKGVKHAGADSFRGDGPDIAVEKQGETWYAVFRDASGDCIAGCFYQRLYYFTVAGGEVTQADEADALADPIFARLSERWR